MQANLLNGLSLAYIGDAVYELIVRRHFLELGYTKVKDLHQQVIRYTSGKAQAEFIHYLLGHSLLSEEELGIFKRGRNSHIHTSRKNIDIQEYLDATGFEALMGYLYLNQRMDRMNYFIEILFGIEKGVSL